jgi:hypothetical protein
LSASVFAFPSRGKGPQPWTNEELAELYRVVDLLGRAGLAVATDMGMSDEGDPWFVFCRVDNDEVIAHFARIDGIFVAASIAVDETFRGANFRQIVDRMVSSQPLVMPRPNPGSKLFLHPAVLLTAFVATALAHSEKMLAQDWLRSVEAQWDHAKSNAMHELKQVKTAWADTLHTLLRLPIAEGRIAYDSAKEGLSLSLASLIAIAMTALQPISDKIAQVTHILMDDLPGHSAQSAYQAAVHAAALAFDAAASAVDDSGAAAMAARHADGNHTGADSPEAHRTAAPASPDSSSSDGAKAVVDASHLSAPVVQKAAFDEAAPHLSVDSQFDIGAAALAVQKVVAVAAQQLESIVVHVDTGAVAVPTLDLQDVTPDAIRLLNIHLDSKAETPATADTGNSGPSSSGITHAASPGAASGAEVGSTMSSSGSAAPATEIAAPTIVAQAQTGAATTVAGPTATSVAANGTQTIDVNNVSGATVVGAISDFVTSGTHAIAQQVTITDAIAQQELAGILSVYNTVKVVFFDSSSPTSDVFLYSPGVVFVEEKDLGATTHLSNAGGDLVLQGGAAGTITLVGVAIVSHAATV